MNCGIPDTHGDITKNDLAPIVHDPFVGSGAIYAQVMGKPDMVIAVLQF